MIIAPEPDVKKQLLSTVYSQIKDLIQMKNGEDNEDNVFEIFQIERKELFHCRFLKYLIESNQQTFVESVLGLPYCSEGFAVELEHTTIKNKDQRRIDILIKCNDYIAAIEAKIDYGKEDNQIYDYSNYIRNNFNEKEAYMYYLTLNGKPSMQSKSYQKNIEGKPKTVHDDYYNIISFVPLGRGKKNIRNIFQWIENIKDEEEKINKNYCKIKLLKDYLYTLIKERIMEKVVSKIDTKENYMAAVEIHNVISDTSVAIAYNFLRKLADTMKEKDKGLVIDKDIKSSELRKLYNGSQISAIVFKKLNFYVHLAIESNLYISVSKSNDNRGSGSEEDKGKVWDYINYGSTEQITMREYDRDNAHTGTRKDYMPSDCFAVKYYYINMDNMDNKDEASKKKINDDMDLLAIDAVKKIEMLIDKQQSTDTQK